MTPEMLKKLREVPVPAGETLNLSWTAPICVGTMFELLDEIESLQRRVADLEQELINVRSEQVLEGMREMNLKVMEKLRVAREALEWIEKNAPNSIATHLQNVANEALKEIEK